MIKPGVVVSGANLHYRQDVTRSGQPQVTVTDLSSFSTNPRDLHLKTEHNKVTTFIKVKRNKTKINPII